MRVLLIAVASLLSTAASSYSCAGSPDILTVEDWRIEQVEGIISGINITVDVRSHASKPFRMIDASYVFMDALGRRISGFKFDPDLKAKPSDVVSTTNGYMGSEMNRVHNMDRADISVTTCVRAIVYEDGSKEDFN